MENEDFMPKEDKNKESKDNQQYYLFVYIIGFG
jgi:hypothetical protein